MARRGQARRGQSIVEYLIVTAAVIIAVAAFAGQIRQGVVDVGQDVETALTTGATQVETLASQVTAQ